MQKLTVSNLKLGCPSRSGIYRICLCLLTCMIIMMKCSQVVASVIVDNAFVRGLPPGQTVTAAFMQLKNKAKGPVKLVAVSSDSSKSAEIHAHVSRDGMMRMEKVENVIIPANGMLEMKPGGYHLMLIDLYKPLREGDIVTVNLQTDDGENITAKLPVRSVLNEHKHSHHHHH